MTSRPIHSPILLSSSLLFVQFNSVRLYSFPRRPTIDGSPCLSHTARPGPPPFTHTHTHAQLCSCYGNERGDKQGRRLERTEREREILLMQLNNQWPCFFYKWKIRLPPFLLPSCQFPTLFPSSFPSPSLHTSSPDLLFLIQIHFTPCPEKGCSKVCKVTLNQPFRPEKAALFICMHLHACWPHCAIVCIFRLYACFILKQRFLLHPIMGQNIKANGI